MNQAKLEAFQSRTVEMFNQAALTLMMSVGHRTGIFDVLAKLPPASSKAIAEAGGYSERYVREWLGSMVTGGIVDYDPAKKTFHLPAEHAASLTRASVPNNLAQIAQWIPILGHVEDHILQAFRDGKGVGYECYHRFHPVMAEESDQTVVASLVEHILPLVPGLIERLQQGIDVLDIGCGSGRAMNRLAATYPNSRFHGYDFSTEGVAAANDEARQQRLANVKFAARDVAAMTETGAFDLITAFDAIHDQAKPAAVLKNIAQALRPGGVLLMQDIKASSNLEENVDHPLGTFLYTVSCLHCMSVSLACGGPGLGAAWGRQLALTMLAEAGFKDVAVHELPHDMMNYYYIARTG